MQPPSPPNPTDWRSQYPFESHELRLDGVRYHYLDEYTGDASRLPQIGDGSRLLQGGGQPILAVHGNPTWSFYWRAAVLGLRDRYRVIAPDHVGCGLSDKPQRYPYRLEQHVANLVRLVDLLDLRDVTLLAHDWGGAIGLGAAVARPDRFSRFVLLNTAAFRSSRIPLRIRVCRTPLLGPLAVRGLNAFARAATWMAVADRRRLSAESAAGLLAPYDTWANRVAIQRFVEDIPLGPAHPSWDTLVEIERGLEQFRDLPIALVWGMRDWCFTPHFLTRFVEIFPRAEVHRLADVGHYVMEEAPHRVVEIVADILNRTQSPMAVARNAGALARLFNEALEPAYALDGDARLVFVNAACAALLGRPAEALSRLKCRYHGGQDAAGDEALVAPLCPPPEAFAGRSVETIVAFSAAGGWIRRRALFVPLLRGDGEVAGVLAVLSASDVEEPIEHLAPSETDASRLHERLARLRHELGDRRSLERLVGESPAARRVRSQVELAAAGQASVLIVGPAGSGRRLVARAIHESAAGGAGPFLPLACDVLHGETLGPLSEALRRAAAEPTGSRGTVVLESVDALPADVQAEACRLLAEADALPRIVATALAPLVGENDGEPAIRGDLAAALSTLVIELTPLRQRLADLPLLSQWLLERENARGEKQLRGFSAEALDRLAEYAWPGDVAELAEHVRLAHAAAAGVEIAAGDLPERIRLAAEAAARGPRPDEAIDLEALLAEIEERLIRQALQRAKGNKTRAAELLGLSRPRLYRRLVQPGLASEGEE